MAKIQFPLQFERQYSNPIDIDMVFETTSILNSYLTDDKRYAGMIVTCKEQEGKIFVLNNDKDEWLTFDNSLYEKTANKVTSFNTPTDIEYPSAKLVKDYVDAKVSNVYKIKGSVADYSSLPTENLTVGDTYNLLDTGDNYVWDGIAWDKLGGTIDLSSYALKTDIKEDVVFQATSLDSLTSPQKIAITTQIDDVLTSGEIDKTKFKNFILEITLTAALNKYYYQCVQYFMISGIATLYFASTQTTGIIKLYVDTLTPANSTLTNYKYYDGIQASASSFSGSTTNYLQSKTNVDEAIKELDTQVKATNDSIPYISLNDNTATEGKYISKLEIDSVNLHKINITKADLPTIPTVTNDLTNDLKSNYDDAYTHSQITHAPSNAEQNVQSDWNQTVDTEDDFIKNKPTIPSKTSDLTNDSGFATETYVNNKVSAVYKPQGSVLFSSLVVGLLVAANSGFVYNITDAFTTNENFVEGAGKSHSAGTNVVIIEHSGNYKFDVLGGTVDLTPYELLSNKVIAWSSTTNDTRYPSEKLVKDSLDAINVGLENIENLSPLRFAGYFTGGTVSNDFNNLIRPFENLTNPLMPDFYLNNVKGAMFVCNAASDFVFNTVYTWVDGVKTTPITFNWAAPYDEGIGTVNFEVGDTISILNFAYDTVENEMFILIKVEKNPAETFVLKNDTITGATKPKITYDAKGLVTAGADLTAEDIPTHQHTKSEITDFPTIPTVPTISTDIETDATSDIKTTSPKAVKTYVDNTIGDIETLLEGI